MSYARLLDQSDDFEIKAGKIQGDKKLGTSTNEVWELQNDYRAWFAKCIVLLPLDLQGRFRSEYEGNWALSKLRSF